MGRGDQDSKLTSFCCCLPSPSCSPETEHFTHLFIHSINIIEHVVLFQAHLGIQQRTRCPQAVYFLMAEIENKHINIECN